MMHHLPAGVAGQSERTLIVVKPDGVQRRLVGQIIQRFERRGFKMVGLKMLQVGFESINMHFLFVFFFSILIIVLPFAVKGVRGSAV